MRLPDDSGSHPTERLESRSMSKDQRLHSQSAPAVQTERRKSPRTAIRKSAYINFEPYDQGGIITDVSETGLRFHTVDSLEQGGIVRVSIFLGASSQIEAVGELMWKDSTRRIGGLRFTVLPAGAADQIRDWAEASNGANPSGVDESESGESRRAAENQEAQIPNPTSFQRNAVSATDNEVSQRASEPKLDLPQGTRPQAAGSDPSAQSPWITRSIRPSAGTPSAQTRSQDLPKAGTLPPGQPWVPPAAYQQPSAMPWITHFDPDPPERRSIFVRGILGGIIICAMLGSAAWFGLRNNNVWQNISIPFVRRAASAPLTSSAVAPPASPSADLPGDPANDVSTANSLPSEPSQPAPSPQASSPARSDAPANTQPDVNAPPASNAESHQAADSITTSAPENKTTQPSALPHNTVPQAAAAGPPPSPTLSAAGGSLAPAPQSVAKVPGAQAPQANDAGESQLALARQYLDGRGHPRNPAFASQLLWSAVEKGNLAAETDLADLYLRGDGVARNCDQARVLLSAASGKGNAEATQKLTELNRTGCR